MTTQATVNRQHKDRLFRKLFNDKKALLSLYNAMNGTAYNNPEELTITTLENVIYMTAKNDVSFAIEGTMNLYEHQSSFNPNMPLRGLFYLSDLLRNYVTKESLDVYASRPIQIPFPKYVVFYNGTEKEADSLELHLKDSFYPQSRIEGEPALNVTCTMININHGHNEELLERCPLLGQYSAFVSIIREYALQKKSLEEAVREAIEVCIQNGVLSDYLSQSREEAFHLILEEYNEELHKKTEEEYWTGVGREATLSLTKKVFLLYAENNTPKEIAEKLEVPIDDVQQILDCLPNSVEKLFE